MSNVLTDPNIHIIISTPRPDKGIPIRPTIVEMAFIVIAIIPDFTRDFFVKILIKKNSMISQGTITIRLNIPCSIYIEGQMIFALAVNGNRRNTVMKRR
jgi:hypothetical protein